MAFLKFNKAELVNLAYSLKREIILASKTGAFCNTSIVTCNTRRYHGLLAVPVDRFGGFRYVLLSALDESRFRLAHLRGNGCKSQLWLPQQYLLTRSARSSSPRASSSSRTATGSWSAMTWSRPRPR